MQRDISSMDLSHTRIHRDNICIQGEVGYLMRYVLLVCSPSLASFLIGDRGQPRRHISSNVLPALNAPEPSEMQQYCQESSFSAVWYLRRCIFAAGSPFDPVKYEGKEIVPTQANNVLVFPGLGFGAVIVKAKTIT